MGQVTWKKEKAMVKMTGTVLGLTPQRVSAVLQPLMVSDTVGGKTNSLMFVAAAAGFLTCTRVIYITCQISAVSVI